MYRRAYNNCRKVEAFFSLVSFVGSVRAPVVIAAEEDKE